ncbi:hypothetical protein ES288_A12G219500v1 [Gossypium darwinii]|uniref:Uncharacterized protein n=1 Tax=Gossypium darwinii TaxID=34276 RepID=A0A5D2ECB6_GOSDA|nr:hypothetical protein ES288_A12G219500v1 [Gossypium darwinii]
MPSIHVDGMNVLKVREVAKEAIGRARMLMNWLVEVVIRAVDLQLVCLQVVIGAVTHRSYKYYSHDVQYKISSLNTEIISSSLV